MAALLLGDSRFPAGGHAHSGGVEPAVTAGTVTDLQTLEWFLRGRLRTAGLVAAGAGGRRLRARVQRNVAQGESAAVVRDDGFWAELDAEADARIAGPRTAGGLAAAGACAAARGAGRLAGGRGAGEPGGFGRGQRGCGRGQRGCGRGQRGCGQCGGRPRRPARRGRSTGPDRITRSCSGRPRRRPGARLPRPRGSPPTRRSPGRSARRCGCLRLTRCGPPGFSPGCAGDIDQVAAQGAALRGRPAGRPALRVRAGP